MYIFNDSIVYLVVIYGVLELDILNMEFWFIILIGVEVSSVYVFEEDFYVVIEEGIYCIFINNVNLDDFGNWDLLGFLEGFLMDYSVQGFEIFEGVFYVGVNDMVFWYENQQLEYFYVEIGSMLQFMFYEGMLLLVGFCLGWVVYLYLDGWMGFLLFNCIFIFNYVIEDEWGWFWYGNEVVGFDFCYVENFE